MHVKSGGRGTERILLLLAALVLGLLFYRLFAVLEKDFEEVPRRLQAGTMVHLNEAQPAEKLAQLLQRGYYYDDPRDIGLIKETIAAGLKGEVDNIGELNKKAFHVPSLTAATKGGASFQKRRLLANRLGGFSGADSSRLYRSEGSASLPSVHDVRSGTGTISGSVASQGSKSLAGILVRLQLLLPQDSMYTADAMEGSEEIATPALRYTTVPGKKGYNSFTAYARTDASGNFAFNGLPEGKAYEVVPLKPDQNFGPPKGVASLQGTTTFTFRMTDQTMRLFSGRDFNILKKEKVLIVRMPGEVRTWYWIIAAIFLGGFLLLHLFLSARLTQTDQFILPVIMLLTGLSLLTLLSLQDPLRDRFLARSTSWYLVAGFAGIFLLLLFDLRKFTQDSGLYRMFAVRGRMGEKGGQWAIAAVSLLLLTIVFGSGPEGSGVKVNLFGLQPSELIKFLLILFLAGFLAANEKFIASYATARKRWNYFHIALAAILAAIFLFLVLGDLGPAIVVCFSFIILFSFARGDFSVMAFAVLIYILSCWLIDNTWIATAVAAGIIALYLLFINKRLSESAVMAFVVMAGFLLVDQVPLLDELLPGPVQRLSDRKAIWQNNWDNEVYGGDQVANGIWAMSSGGVTGQGIGEGFGKTIPEAHTDMILPALGEELGWTGIICLFILFLVYLHRSILIGRQSGRPFLFYACAGIGISTFVQFLLIAGGSTGALPLSGISLPFISYGGSSLILNMIAAGFLISASFVRGTAVQMEYVTQQQDKNLVPAMAAALVGVVLLGVNVSRYLFHPAKWVIEPALVADRSGARMFSYNPRIAILMNRLEAGNLYDRQNRLLATSDPAQLQLQKDTLIKSGITPAQLSALGHKRYERYYPFAEHMFFWTGDANTGVFTGSLNGFFAEYALAAELRGFATPEVAFPVIASRYREDRFLPAVEKEMTVVKKDFSALSSLLLAGINSKAVEDFKKQNRDVQLSMDAALQTGLQQALSIDDSVRNKRVSIVVMEDRTGQVLASATWPLPPVNDWEQLTMNTREQVRSGAWLTLKDLGFTHATQPGSTAKLVTALAALNKFGTSIATKQFPVRQQDLIRIKGPEPDETGMIDMKRALVRSNNVYFIRLANEEALEKEMAALYMQSGMFLRGIGGYYYNYPSYNNARATNWMNTWQKTEFSSRRRYDPQQPRKTRGLGISGMAWGQGELIATPASVARIAAAIANDGNMVPGHFVLKISDSVLPAPAAVVVAKPEYAHLLTGFMKEQSAGKVSQLGMQVAGKTGTPERIVNGKRINDGWYVFFAPSLSGNGHIVTCIRIESTRGSSDAVKLAGKTVIPALVRGGYIKGFAPTSPGRRDVPAAVNNGEDFENR